MIANIVVVLGWFFATAWAFAHAAGNAQPLPAFGVAAMFAIGLIYAIRDALD